ncbi:hypothetical protein Tco_0765919 [Tanacetum coccineum]
MPDDDLVSLTGFETPDSADNDSQEGTAKTFNAFVDMPAQSDPLGHLHEELRTLNTKVDQLESSISKKVTGDIQSSVRSIVADTLKENLLGLLSKALKNTLPQMIKDSIKQSVSESIEEKLPLFVTLQQELSKVIKTKLGVSVRNKVRKGMQAVSNKLASVQSTMATNSQHVQDLRREQPPAHELLNVEQAPPVSEENALVLHALVEKSSEENTSEKNVSDDEPSVKKLKFLISTSSSYLSPTPFKSILHEPIRKPDTTKMTIEQFTEHLNKTTLSIFSPTPLRVLTPLRDPTPPRDESKRKGIATEEPLKDIMPFMEEGGSVPKIPSFKSFVIPEGQLTNEDVMAQLKEMKRLVDLKAEKEKSEKSLQKIINPGTIRAQVQKMADYEAKRKKMLDEYNHQISHRVDQLPIIKISYRVNSSKEATMRITKGNDPLNLTVYEKFRLKTLGFSEWLEAKALGIPPPPELSTFGISINDTKRKRISEILQEVFVKENVVVNGMHKNLVPPSGVEGRKGLVIREPESGVFFYNGNFDLTSTSIEGLAECKASASNLRRIQVKDIVKEVKDYLKAYSSAGMDIS